LEIKQPGAFAIVVVVLLAALAVVEFTTARGDSATFDEMFHITAGYVHLRLGDFRLNQEHPPLVKLLAALPLTLLNPRIPLELPSWQRVDQWSFSADFLYRNRVPADTMLLASRSVIICLTLLFGLALALWTRAQFGAPAALFALFLFVTDPNLIAHGHYVTMDLALAFFVFLATIAWSRYLVRKRLVDLVWSGAALGLALLTKHPALLLLPLFVLLYLVRAWQEWGQTPPAARRLSLERFVFSALALGVICIVLMAAVYGFHLPNREPIPPPAFSPQRLAGAVNPAKPAGHFLLLATRAFHLPDHPYLAGLFGFSNKADQGHPGYLLGRRSEHGWWYYFPVAMAVKTPSAVVLLTLAALGTAILLLRGVTLAALRALPFSWIAGGAVIAAFLGVGMMSTVQIGLRYILPVYPFLLVLVAGVVFRIWAPRSRRALPYVLGAVLLVQAGEAAAIYPYYLSFFNTLSGGPANGSRYLLDSNLDWGQDLKRLKQYTDRHGIKSLCTSYFGTAEAGYYKIPGYPLQAGLNGPGFPCRYAAISLTNLYEVYLTPGSFAWLRRMKPVDRIGYSIYLYDLGKSR
jgi:4-amino-4-deoxy-L-arabinose transferase-like glycosyltransferase